MNEIEPGYNANEGENSGHASHHPLPQRKREPRGWLFWVLLVLALAALLIYSLNRV